MKKITIPSTIMICNPDGSPAVGANGSTILVSFKEFLANTLLVDPKFGKGMAEILSAVELKNKLCSAEPGSEVELDKADYDRLLAVAEEPTNAYNPVVVMQLVPFLNAIKDAK